MRSFAAACAILVLVAPPAIAQGFDIMSMADSDRNGEVTLEEWTAFSEQGWDYISQGQEKVKVADLDQFSQMAFTGVEPDAEGYVDRQAYIDAIPRRFEMVDRDRSGTLKADELAIPGG